jgi:hypothetical protein
LGIEAAQQAYADGQAALAVGDFAAYGEAQERLRLALEEIARAEDILNPQPEAVPAPPEELPEDLPEGEGATTA